MLPYTTMIVSGRVFSQETKRPAPEAQQLDPWFRVYGLGFRGVHGESSHRRPCFGGGFRSSILGGVFAEGWEFHSFVGGRALLQFLIERGRHTCGTRIRTQVFLTSTSLQ